MHPAFSVIFFTTSSGAGYGMLFIFGLMASLGMLPQDSFVAWAGVLVSLGLISAGLMSSTFHLGHPERAWRAVSQWRSSWLAREGVVAILTYVPAVYFAYGWIFDGMSRSGYAIAGGLAAAGAVITVFCTGSIYNSLKTIHQWANGWTMPNYLMLALMTGMLLVNLILLMAGIEPKSGFYVAQLVVVLIAWGFKFIYWRFISTTHHPATIESATGLKHLGKVSVLELPHTEENYLLKEMGYKIGRKHADKLRKISHISLFLLPLAASIGSISAEGATLMAMAVVAVLASVVGVLLERWLFFAEARHVVTLYYGREC